MDKNADAMPTKDFFVRMITRDISLEDCILDLIDNCLDGALTPLYVKTAAQEASLSCWRVRKSLMTR